MNATIPVASTDLSVMELDRRAGPLQAFGYLQERFVPSIVQRRTALRSIRHCAKSHNLGLTAVFVDEIETAPEELFELMARLPEVGKCALIMPSLLHLAILGHPLDVRKSLQDSQIEVLVTR